MVNLKAGIYAQIKKIKQSVVRKSVNDRKLELHTPPPPPPLPPPPLPPPPPCGLLLDSIR